MKLSEKKMFGLKQSYKKYLVRYIDDAYYNGFYDVSNKKFCEFKPTENDKKRYFIAKFMSFSEIDSYEPASEYLLEFKCDFSKNYQSIFVSLVSFEECKEYLYIDFLVYPTVTYNLCKAFNSVFEIIQRID